MCPEDLSTKLAVIREQTRSKGELQERQLEAKKQELLFANNLQNAVQANQAVETVEIIKLKHELDVEVRQRNQDDDVFYKNIDLQDFIKRQQLTHSHLLEEIHHTTVSAILEKVILLIITARLDSEKRPEEHSNAKDLKTHENTLQIKLEEAKAVIASKYGNQNAEDICDIVGGIMETRGLESEGLAIKNHYKKQNKKRK